MTRARVLALLAASSLLTGVLGALPTAAADARATGAADEALDGVTASAPHRAFVAVVTGRGPQAAPYDSDAAITEMVDRALAYWVTESGGAISTFTRAGAIRTFTPSTPGCDINTLTMQGAALFPEANAGASVDHVLVLAPDMNGSCAIGAGGFAPVGTGFGSAGGSISHLTPAFAEGILYHELGHIFGFGHANAVKCPGGVCQAPAEYADPYSVMATGHMEHVPALGSLHRRLNGVQASGEALDLALAAGETTLDSDQHLAPLTAAGGQRSLTITDPVDAATYTVEYRSGTGRDTGAIYTQPTPPEAIFPDMIVPSPGVVVTRCNGQSSQLMVRSESNYYRGQYDVGTTFTSPSGGVSVEVTAAGPALGADVSVSLAGPAPTPGAPYVAPTPQISGSPQVGQRLFAYSGLPPEWNRSYRWTADGVTVAGSAQPYVTLTSDMVGKSLRVEVTGRRCGAANAVSTSAPVTATAAPNPPTPGTFSASKPTINGTAKQGKKLTVVPGAWGPQAPALTFQWFVGRKPVARATGRTFKLKKSSVGKKVTVSVTGTRTGYTTLTVVSKATKKVKPK